MESQDNKQEIFYLWSSVSSEITDIRTNLDSYRGVILQYTIAPSDFALKADLKEDCKNYIKEQGLVVPRGGSSSWAGFQSYMKHRWKLQKISSLYTASTLDSAGNSFHSSNFYLTKEEDFLYMLKLKCPRLNIQLFNLKLKDV